MVRKKKRANIFEQADRKLEEEGRKQSRILFGATCIALWRHWGKRRKALLNYIQSALDVYNECAADINYSMIQICENETGIEIQNGEGKSWQDLAFLNATLDVGKMTGGKYLYMRQQQLKWVQAQMAACILVALHRKYGFGYERCARIYGQIQEVEKEFGDEPVKICDMCKELTGIDIIEELRPPKDE